MFEKLKQLNQIRQLKNELEKEVKTVEKEGVKVTVRGNFQVEDIQLNSQMDFERQAKVLKECINEAMKQIQVEAAQKMFKMQ
jgi:DNA-binding protein YbaB